MIWLLLLPAIALLFAFGLYLGAILAFGYGVVGFIKVIGGITR